MSKNNDALHIDDDENVDWLHHNDTRFSITVGEKEIGKVDLKKQRIATKDAELEEYFYQLIDEGIDESGPILENGGKFVEAMKKEGYKATPVAQ